MAMAVIQRGEMSRAELRTSMEFLGYGREDMAAYVGVSERSVRYWLTGKHAISGMVADKLDELDDFTDGVVADVVDRIKGGETTVLVYELDQELWVNRPEFKGRPAKWYRLAVARAVTLAGEGDVEFWGDDERTRTWVPREEWERQQGK